MCADRKPRQSARGHPVWRRNGGRHEHAEHVVARRRVHVHGRGDRHVGHGHPLGTDGGPEGSERWAQRFPDIEQGPCQVAVPVERQCQCRVHGILETVVTGEPQLLEAEPGGAAEAALQPLHRVQAVGQAPEDPDGAAWFVRRQRAVPVGVRVYQVGGRWCTVYA